MPERGQQLGRTLEEFAARKALVPVHAFLRARGRTVDGLPFRERGMPTPHLGRIDPPDLDLRRAGAPARQLVEDDLHLGANLPDGVGRAVRSGVGHAGGSVDPRVLRGAVLEVVEGILVRGRLPDLELRDVVLSRRKRREVELQIHVVVAPSVGEVDAGRVVPVEQLRLLGAAAVPAVVLGAIRPVHLRDAGDGEPFRVRREQRSRKKEKKRK